MISCPKCSHQQTNPDECEACGLLFRKFELAQAHKKEKESEQRARKPGVASAPRLVSTLVLVALTAALTYYFAIDRQGKTSNPAPPAVDWEAKRQAQSPQQTTAVAKWPPPATIKAPPIDHAKNATVAIETPWGKGAGFFISETSVVTNKHVVAPDQSQLAEIRHEVETSRKLITLEQEKMAELRRKMNQIGEGPTRQQLAIIIQEREKELAKMLPVQIDREAKLESMEKPLSTTDIKIFLADSSEYAAQVSNVSSERDLALLTVYADNTTVLQPAPPNRALNQGDKVYAVGNPVGLRNTVTAGIFSGYRQREDTKEVFLQIDAPINPGNSGGPLIDEQGFVHGVNTMIIKDTQGIGFAIPIQTVIEEFSLSPLQEQ